MTRWWACWSSLAVVAVVACPPVDRDPFAPPVVAVAPEAESAPTMRLAGIVVSPAGVVEVIERSDAPSLLVRRSGEARRHFGEVHEGGLP